MTNKQKEFLELVRTGKRLSEAKTEVGIVPKTWWTWQKDEEFQSAFKEAQWQAFGEAAAELFHDYVELAKNGRSEMVRANVMKDIMDRAGFVPDENINLKAETGVKVVIVDDLTD